MTRGSKQPILITSTLTGHALATIVEHRSTTKFTEEYLPF